MASPLSGRAEGSTLAGVRDERLPDRFSGAPWRGWKRTGRPGEADRASREPQREGPEGPGPLEGEERSGLEAGLG